MAQRSDSGCRVGDAAVCGDAIRGSPCSSHVVGNDFDRWGCTRPKLESGSHGFAPSSPIELIVSLKPVHPHAQGRTRFTEGADGVGCQQQGSDKELVQAGTSVRCCTLPIPRGDRVGPQTDQGEDILRRRGKHNVMSSLTG